MYAFLTIAVAFAASALGTRAISDWLATRKLVAVENDRTMHSGSVPQGGGAAVISSALCTAIAMWPWSPWHTVLIPAAVCLAAVSAANDRQDIAFQWRLTAHLVAAMLVLALIPEKTLIFGGILPFAFDRLVALVAFGWFINLYNFMDGIDGITGVETMTLAGGAVALSWSTGASAPLDGLALAIFGASAGFLIWNWHKARIFLGDVGSIPLGFLTGALLLQIATTQSLAAAVILPMYYLADASLTLLRRFWRGEKVWLAHRSHAYQRSALAIGSHSPVVVRIAACNCVLIVAAIVALKQPWLGLALGAGAVTTLLWSLERIARTSQVAATPQRSPDRP